MDKFPVKKILTQWTSHPSYFVICLAIGFAFWSLCFEKEKNTVQTIQLSSFAENLAHVHGTESEAISRLSMVKKHKKELPRKFKDNPAFMVFQKIEDLVNEN